MIETFVEGMAEFVMLGFALTMLIVAWVVPVAVIFGVITICTSGGHGDE
jgi:hypothetical protein